MYLLSRKVKESGGKQIKKGLFWAENHPPSKFHGNLLGSFCIIQLTNQLTSGHGWKHNIVGRGQNLYPELNIVLCSPHWRSPGLNFISAKLPSTLFVSCTIFLTFLMPICKKRPNPQGWIVCAAILLIASECKKKSELVLCFTLPLLFLQSILGSGVILNELRPSGKWMFCALENIP